MNRFPSKANRERPGSSGFSLDLDQAGAAASLLCAVHCALTPLVVTLLPLIGLGFLADERTEWILVGLSALLGVGSLCLGFRAHRRRRVFAVLSIGLALLAGGRLVEARRWGHSGVPLVVLGGLAIAMSHVLNRRLCHACRVCHPEVEKQEWRPY